MNGDAWADPARAIEDRAAALVRAADGPEGKRLGRWLDAQADRPLRFALVALARARGVDLPDEAVDWPGKRLLRLARAKEEGARVAKNPIARDEAFTCAACGREVPPHGRSARDHCPWCLRSVHVDGDVPGDRAAACGGLLDPVAIALANGRATITFRCRSCGATRRCRAAEGIAVPDDPVALARVGQ